jgi:hypothetical protein
VIGIFALLLVLLGWKSFQLGIENVSQKDVTNGITYAVSGVLVFMIWLTMGGR